jgi:hypothetical protein
LGSIVIGYFILNGSLQAAKTSGWINLFQTAINASTLLKSFKKIRLY